MSEAEDSYDEIAAGPPEEPSSAGHYFDERRRLEEKYGSWANTPQEEKDRIFKIMKSVAARSIVRGIHNIGTGGRDVLKNSLLEQARRTLGWETEKPIDTTEALTRKLDTIIRGEPGKPATLRYGKRTEKEVGQLQLKDPRRAGRLRRKQGTLPGNINHDFHEVAKGLSEIWGQYARAEGVGGVLKTTAKLGGAMAEGIAEGAVKAVFDPHFVAENPLEAVGMPGMGGSILARLGNVAKGGMPAFTKAASAAGREGARAASPLRAVREVGAPFAAAVMPKAAKAAAEKAGRYFIDSEIGMPEMLRGVDSPGQINLAKEAAREASAATKAEKGHLSAVQTAARKVGDAGEKARAKLPFFRESKARTEKRIVDAQNTVMKQLAKLDKGTQALIGHALAKTAAKEKFRGPVRTKGKPGPELSLIEKRYDLIDDFSSLYKNPGFVKVMATLGRPVGELPDILGKNPALFDKFRKDYLGKADELAQEVNDAAKYGDFHFLYDGLNMGTPEFLIKRLDNFDEAKITSVGVPTGMQAASPATARNIQSILTIKKLQSQVSREANMVEIAPGVKLLDDPAFRVHLSDYLGDVYQGRKTSVDLLGLERAPGDVAKASVVKPGLRNVRGMYEPGSLGMFERAQYKHAQSYRQRVAEGLIPYEELNKLIGISIPHSIRTVERYRMFDQLANPEKYGMLPKGSAQYTGIARTAEEAARITAQTGKKLRYIPGKGEPGHQLVGGGLPKWGALERKWVDPAVFEKIDQVLKFQDGALQRITRVVGSWKATRLLQNAGPWLHTMTGNGTLQILDDGLPTAPFSVAARRMGKKAAKDPVYRAALEDGAIRPGKGKFHGESADEVAEAIEGMLGRARSYEEFGGLALKYLDKGVDLYEYMALRNPISKKLTDMWASMENASRLAIYERALKSWGKTNNMSLERAIRQSDARNYARGRVDLLHLDYDAMPHAISFLDKTGLMPFSRYAFGMTKLMFQLSDMMPVKMATARQARRESLQEADTRGRITRYVQPSYMRGMWIPTVADSSKGWNTKYLNLAVVPSEILSYTPRGSFGREMFDDSFDSSFWRTVKQMGGPWKPLLEIIGKENYNFGRPLRSRFSETFLKDSWLGKFVGPRTMHAVYSWGPGFGYHGGEKILPALAGKGKTLGRTETARGRMQTPTEATGGAVGLRVSEQMATRKLQDVVKSQKSAIRKAKNDAEKSLKASYKPNVKYILRNLQARIDQINELAAYESSGLAPTLRGNQVK